VFQIQNRGAERCQGDAFSFLFSVDLARARNLLIRGPADNATWCHLVAA
jgi:hypothetical protein